MFDQRQRRPLSSMVHSAIVKQRATQRLLRLGRDLTQRTRVHAGIELLLIRHGHDARSKLRRGGRALCRPLTCTFDRGDDGTRTHDPLLAKQVL